MLGIALGNAAWLCVTLGGVAVLLQQFPGGMRALRYVGGLYLLYRRVLALVLAVYGIRLLVSG